MPRVSTLGVSWNAPPEDRTNPSSSRVSSSRRAVGRASPAAVATSVSDMARWSASKQVRTSSPRARASTKSGPAPRPAISEPSWSAPLQGPAASLRAVGGSGVLLLPPEHALHAARALGLVLVVGVLVRVVQDLRLGLRPLREHALLPGLLADLGPQVLDR